MDNAAPLAQEEFGFDVTPVPPTSRARGARAVRRAPSPDPTGPKAAPPVGRYADLSPDKLRGGYYTPAPVAAWLCRWAIRTPRDAVLEPSCGDGAVLGAAVDRLLALGATPEGVAAQAIGVEMTRAEADAARRRLAGRLGETHARRAVACAEFFAWHAGEADHGCAAPRRGGYDAVVGNPPFIRYQTFPEPARARAMGLMTGLGLRPNRLTNIWVPFVVAAAESLREGGRLALVVPAELLQVTYAAQLRAYLSERFARLDVVACNELMFEGAEQEVVLLLAEGALAARAPGHRGRIAVAEVATLADLAASDPVALVAAAEEKDVRGGEGEKWLKYFLSDREIGLMRALRAHPGVAPLSRLAEVDVGVVTGKNEFFVLRRSELDARGLGGLARRTVARSAHLRGAALSGADWAALDAADERVHLLDLRDDGPAPLPRAALAYVREGEAKDWHRGYKCSIRSPWYHVPAAWEPHAFLFRQIHGFPRMVLNGAGAASTDTIHRVSAREGHDPAAVVAATYTTLTAASAEIEGRSYGGGVLELEPTEAERLLVVPPGVGHPLALEEADALVRAGRLSALLEENDRRLLGDALGLAAGERAVVRGAWEKMRGRRAARGKRAKRPG